MSSKYKFYMSRFVNNAWSTAVSLEDYFWGLKYLSCKGLSDKGKIKNIYSESYMDSDELRVYIPDNPVRENTDIEFEFGFSGENRRNLFDDFVSYITGYKLRYWDTARNREVEMLLMDKIEVDQDILLGSSPFIVVPFKFKNLKGQTIVHDDDEDVIMFSNQDSVLW